MKDIKDKYPALFKKCWDFSTGDGWHDIIEETCEKLSKFDGLTIAQIKEKFAVLTIHPNLPEACGEEIATKIYSIISNACGKSAITCEHCGATGRECNPNGYWLKTLCPDCEQKAERDN